MKSDKKKFEKYLDDLWKIAVRMRDNWLCQYTLLTKRIKKQGGESHHIFSRTHRNTRWDTENGIYLLRGHGLHDAHKEPEIFRDFLINKWFGSQKIYDDLFIRSHTQTHFKLGDLKAWEEYLLGEIKKELRKGKKLDARAIKKLPKATLLRLEYDDNS